jgi:hypothetical protein
VSRKTQVYCDCCGGGVEISSVISFSVSKVGPRSLCSYPYDLCTKCAANIIQKAMECGVIRVNPSKFEETVDHREFSIGENWDKL